MAPWNEFRLWLYRYNSYLLIGMCGLIFSTQMTMVYLHRKGERVRVNPEEMFVKGEITSKIEEFIQSLTKMKRLDPFKEDKQENAAKEKSKKQPEDNQDT